MTDGSANVSENESETALSYAVGPAGRMGPADGIRAPRGSGGPHTDGRDECCETGGSAPQGTGGSQGRIRTPQPLTPLLATPSMT